MVIKCHKGITNFGANLGVLVGMYAVFGRILGNFYAGNSEASTSWSGYRICPDLVRRRRDIALRKEYRWRDRQEYSRKGLDSREAISRWWPGGGVTVAARRRR